MIVNCPYCSTRYEIDATRLAGSNPMLKCSRCRHIFPAPSAKRSASPSSSEKSAPADEENLTLPFDEPVWKDEAPSAPALRIPETDEGYTLGTDDAVEERNTPPAAAPEADVTAVAHAATPPGAASAENEDVEVEHDELIDEQENDEPIEPPKRRRSRAGRTPPPRERSHIGAFFIFLALVVGAYGVLTRALFASPALSDRLIGRLPLIGTLSDERLLTRKVAISDVVGNYQHIKDGKDVFVITGKALNTAPVALHGVQVVGKLFNHSGRVLDSKVIYCGNVISAKVLKDLTPRELSILQKLSPPKKFVIEPGESTTFVVVFMDPPREAVEFTAQVAAAQRQA